MGRIHTRGLGPDHVAPPGRGDPLRDARRELRPRAGAGAFLLLSGTITYAVGNDWNLVDSFYFAVATLTTSSIADPDLVLVDGWMKLFTVFYILVGIGILVEIVRRFGMAFVEIRRQERDRST